MKMDLCFIDFDDSFSYNIIQEVHELGFKVRVLHWMDFEALPPEEILILGPGPGHPDDYQRIFPLINEWMAAHRPLFGVCLGHQIYWRLQGESVVRSREPIHGQSVELDLDAEWQDYLRLPEKIRVQRYNSLAVPAQAAMRNPLVSNFIFQDEVLMTKGKNLLTYQFHPESMGTSFRRSFFRPLIDHLV
jgi:anthranilate/para-aminobenzoate synthase component II